MKHVEKNAQNPLQTLFCITSQSIYVRVKFTHLNLHSAYADGLSVLVHLNEVMMLAPENFFHRPLR